MKAEAEEHQPDQSYRVIRALENAALRKAPFYCYQNGKRFHRSQATSHCQDSSRYLCRLLLYSASGSDWRQHPGGRVIFLAPVAFPEIEWLHLPAHIDSGLQEKWAAHPLWSGTGPPPGW